ncbi:MAG: endo-1,4-beta-xylanase [Capsulimonadaceae bacterium]|nr:endo-1,4-beta-xylanase [Capsulimonadaceae bacterium]
MIAIYKYLLPAFVAMFLPSVLTHAAPLPLPAGTDLLQTNKAAVLGFRGGADSKAEVISVAGQTFDSALRCTCGHGSMETWDVRVEQLTTRPVQKGDVILFSFWVQAERPQDGSARIGAFFQKASGDYDKLGQALFSPPGKWTRIDVPFVSPGTFAAGEAGISFHLAYAPQVIDIGGVSVVDYGTAVDLDSLPSTKLSYAGRDPNAAWRRAADANIERYRTTDVVVKVVNAKGSPLRGAAVVAKMQRHAFPFGTCVDGRLLRAADVDSETYRTKVASLFSIATDEGALKWPSWSRNPAGGVGTVDWLNAHGIISRGHNLVWPSWTYQSKQLRADYEAQLASGGKDAAARWLSDTIDKHIVDEMTVLKGKCPEWDVVNEPVVNHVFQDILGSGALSHWYRVAHSVDPSATLFINEDGSVYGQTSDARVDAVIGEIDALLKDGAPLGGIGLESHMNPLSLPSPDQLTASLNQYAKFHLPIRVTEYDLKTTDKDLEADYTRDYLTLCFSNPAVTGFVMWGFWDGSHWLHDAPIYNKDWTLKPSGKAYMDLVYNKWWTNASGNSDAKGRYAFRGYQGTYEVTVTYKGKSRTRQVVTGEAGSTATIVLD